MVLVLAAELLTALQAQQETEASHEAISLAVKLS
jgi:hypothetical protein